MAEAISQEYLSSLYDLTINSKPLINMLTMLADENVAHATSIADVIEKHIINVSAETKLPILYLIDSIVKNIPSYTPIFANKIVNIFVTSFQKVDEKTRTHMYKLRQTWNDVFPTKKLYELDLRVREIDPAWPVSTAPPSIHLNPKFLGKTAEVASRSTSSSKISQSKPKIQPEDRHKYSLEKQLQQLKSKLDQNKYLIEKEKATEDHVLQRQRKLLEIQYQKIELDLKLLEAQKDLEDQDSPKAVVVPLEVKPKTKSIKPQEWVQSAEPRAVIIPPERQSKSKEPRSSGIVQPVSTKVKIAPVNAQIIRSITSRDPRLLRKQAESSGPMEKTRDPMMYQLAMLKPTVAPTVLSEHFEKEFRHEVHRPTSKPKTNRIERNERNKKESDTRKIKKEKKIEIREKNKKSSPKKDEKKFKKEILPERIKKEVLPERIKKEVLPERIKKEVRHEVNSFHASKPKIIRVEKNEKVRKESDTKRVRREKKVEIKEKKKEIPKKEVKEIKKDVLEYDMIVSSPSPEPPPPPHISQNEVITEMEDVVVLSDPEVKDSTVIKKTKGKSKSRNYMRRNREVSTSPAKSDVDLRTKISTAENLVSVSGCGDVDLRTLTPKKRLSSERESSESEPPAKKNKQVFEDLFGNEDVDLRTIMPPKQPSPQPPQSTNTESAVVIAPSSSPTSAPLDKESDVAESEDDKSIRSWAELKVEQTSGDSPMLLSSQLELEMNRQLQNVDVRREAVTSQKAGLTGDTDMRQPILDNSEANINLIIAQAQEQLKNGNLTPEECNQVLSQVAQLIEVQKLQEAKKREELDKKPSFSPASSEEESEQYGDVDERYRPSASRNVPRGRWNRGGGNRGRGFSRREFNPMYRQGNGPGPRPFGPGNMYPGPVEPYRNTDHPPQGYNNRRVLHPHEPPLPSPMLLDAISKDRVKRLHIDGIYYDIRYYGETAVIFFSDTEPKQIMFHDGERRVTIGNTTVLCRFNGPYETFLLGGVMHRVRLGSPTREFYIDDVPYEGSFGGQPTPVVIDGVQCPVFLEAPPPAVKIGALRTDLVLGRINLIIDAAEKVTIYLDAKPQRFDIDGKPHVLQFVNSLAGMLINGRIFEADFGGLPRPIVVHGQKRYIRFTALPEGVMPGMSEIANMDNIPLPSGPKVVTFTPQITQPTTIDLDNSNSNETFPPKIRVKPHHLLSNVTPFTANTDVSEQPQPPPTPVLGLDFLTSLMPTTSGPEQLTGSGYHISGTNDVKPVTDTVAAVQPTVEAIQNLNINDLFQKLVDIGIVPKKTNEEEEAEKKLEPKPKPKPSVKLDTKVHYVDFFSTPSMNQKQPGIINTLHSGIQCSSCGVRFSPDETVQYSRHLDWHFRQNRREKDSSKKLQLRKWYYIVSDWKQYEEMEDVEQRAQSWFETEREAGDDDNEEEGVIPCVTAPTEGTLTICEMCHDRFELFYNEDEEEWQLRRCVLEDGKYYHPLCHSDMLKALETPMEEDTIKEEDEPMIVDSKPEDETIEIIEVTTNEAKPSEEILLDETEEVEFEMESEEESVAFIVECLVDVVVKQEKLEICRQQRELEEHGFTSIPVPPKNIILDEDFYEKVDDDIQLHFSPPPGFVPNIKIKQEPLDEMETAVSSVDQTIVNVISSIDGNLELEAPKVITPSENKPKIKINISKPVIQVEPKVKPSEINNDVEELEEPPPPFQPKKPGLMNKKIQEYPKVEKGHELSGLCSIM